MTSPPATESRPNPSEVILERGQAIDRFVVLGLVGRGGMGEVYAAYDPELDRKVAIKLLRARGETADGRTRLLREAQATAKLQHPNVIVVYDVGTFGESVFIAMEFVEGRTANGWLHAAPRSRREILDVYLAAGRGLAAAHSAGLVHRDFKPDNVMVTNDGQVRVMDFGLARQVDEREGGGERPPRRDVAELAAALEAPFEPGTTRDLSKPASVETTSGKYLSLKLTQTGAMLGTPAYMAPEQFAVQPTDARTDQFSFCVALYEALYGHRPFEGDSFLALMTSVTTGTVRTPPAKAKVPTWMRRVLLRGLQVDPERRHASMTALLTALQTDPTVRTRRTAVAVVALAGIVTAGVGVRRMGGAQQAMCRGGGDRLTGVWELAGTSPRKEAIHRAFAATGKPFAEQAFAGAARYLDQFVAAWAGMYRDTCEATHVRGEQSAEVLDLRMACLQQRLVDLRALTDELAVANAKTVENAASATSSLPRIDHCADVRALRAVVKPPADEATRRRVEQLREQRARLTALRHAGKCDEGRKLEEALLSAARQIGYFPLEAEAAYEAFFVEDTCGAAFERFFALGREAYTSSLAAGLDQLAAEASSIVAGMSADRMRDLERAREWLGFGRALATRIGGDQQTVATLDQAEGTIASYAGDTKAALAALGQSQRINEKLHGRDHPYVATLLGSIGNAYVGAGRYEEGLRAFHEARDIFVKVGGAEHPWVAMIDSNMGEALNGLGRYGEARAAFEHAVATWTAQHTDPSILAYAQTGLGRALLGDGRPGDAVAPLERALAARTEAKLPPELLGEPRFALARALFAKPAQRERALALAREARAEYASAGNAAGTVKEIDAWLAAPQSRASSSR